MLGGTLIVRQAHAGGLSACVGVRESDSESESKSERVCVCVCEDLLDGRRRREEGKSTLDADPLFAWQLLFCVRPDLCSPCSSLGSGLVWEPRRECGAEKRIKVDSERLTDKAPTRLGLFCSAAAKFDPVSQQNYQESINPKSQEKLLFGFG